MIPNQELANALRADRERTIHEGRLAREAACHRACCHPTRLDRIAGRLGLNDCVGGTTR
jgi:hypothetical protein